MSRYVEEKEIEVRKATEYLVTDTCESCGAKSTYKTDAYPYRDDGEFYQDRCCVTVAKNCAYSDYEESVTYGIRLCPACFDKILPALKDLLENITNQGNKTK